VTEIQNIDVWGPRVLDLYDDVYYNDEAFRRLIEVTGRKRAAEIRFRFGDYWMTTRSHRGLSSFFPKIKYIGDYIRHGRRYGLSYGYDFPFSRQEVRKVAKHLNPPGDRIYTDWLLASPSRLWREWYDHICFRVQYVDQLTISPDSVILNFGIGTGFEIPYLQTAKKIYHIDLDGDKYLDPYVRQFIQGAPEKNVFIRASISNPQDPLRIIDQYKIKRVDIVKADIEGSEDILVQGLAPVIQRDRPQLAISVYHHISHFIGLPLRLISMCRDYDFAFGHYSWEIYEGVFYCLPKR